MRTAGTTTAAAPLLMIERWHEINRAAGGIDQIRCSSGRDAVIILAWAYSPRSIQGNRFERRLCIFYS